MQSWKRPDRSGRFWRTSNQVRHFSRFTTKHFTNLFSSITWNVKTNHFFFFPNTSFPPGLTEDLNPTPIISFNEALQYFQTTDLGDLLVRKAAHQKFSNKSWYFNHKQPLNNSLVGLPSKCTCTMTFHMVNQAKCAFLLNHVIQWNNHFTIKSSQG